MPDRRYRPTPGLFSKEFQLFVRLKNRLTAMADDFVQLKWMMATTIALNLVILIKLFMR